MCDTDHDDPQNHPADTFHFLLATDIHLGYNESDPERCYDSFRSFEEVLHTAVSRDVDFLLLGFSYFLEIRCISMNSHNR